MNRLPLIIILLFVVGVANMPAADANVLLESIKQRMQKVASYTADLKIHVDISFMKVPDTKARITYTAPDKTNIVAPGFAMLPKQGADLSALKLLSKPYAAVDAGTEMFQGIRMRKIKVIPADDGADIAVATLLIDTTLMVPRKIVTTSRTGGTATAELVYDNTEARAAVLPSYIKLMFEVGKFDLPKTMTGDFEKSGNGEQGTGNGERGTGNGERGTGNSGRRTMDAGRQSTDAVVEVWYMNYRIRLK